MAFPQLGCQQPKDSPSLLQCPGLSLVPVYVEGLAKMECDQSFFFSLACPRPLACRQTWSSGTGMLARKPGMHVEGLFRQTWGGSSGMALLARKPEDGFL